MIIHTSSWYMPSKKKDIQLKIFVTIIIFLIHAVFCNLEARAQITSSNHHEYQHNDLVLFHLHTFHRGDRVTQTILGHIIAPCFATKENSNQPEDQKKDPCYLVQEMNYYFLGSTFKYNKTSNKYEKFSGIYPLKASQLIPEVSEINKISPAENAQSPARSQSFKKGSLIQARVGNRINQAQYQLLAVFAQNYAIVVYDLDYQDLFSYFAKNPLLPFNPSLETFHFSVINLQ